MKLFLFFDTETTGKNDFKSRFDAHHQPNLVQLCALLIDENEKRQGSCEMIIKPDGWEIPADAAAIHGITHELALRVGIGRNVALRIFSNFCKLADEYGSHNADFDLMMIRTASFRENAPHRLDEKPTWCTKEMGVPVVKLKPNFPGADYKWPSLTELHKFLFGEEFAGAHGALADTIACARCFFEMRRRNPVSNARGLWTPDSVKSMQPNLL